MTLQGWSYARSPTGRASLVPEPPWHFSANVAIVDFRCHAESAAELFPPGMEAAGDGSGSVVIGSWSASADSDDRLITDPARGQYHEAYVVLYGTFRHKRVGRIPYMWVDSDMSLVRGLIQGFPKRLGEVALSQPVVVGRGGPTRAAGQTFHGHVSSGGERVLEASVTLEAAALDEIPRGITTPLVHARWWPSLAHDEPEINDFARNHVTDFAVAEMFRGSGTLRFREARYEEVKRLEPVEILGGWFGSVAFTVVGGTIS